MSPTPANPNDPRPSTPYREPAEETVIICFPQREKKAPKPESTDAKPAASTPPPTTPPPSSATLPPSNPDEDTKIVYLPRRQKDPGESSSGRS